MTKPSGRRSIQQEPFLCSSCWTVNPNQFLNEFHTLNGSFLFGSSLMWNLFVWDREQSLKMFKVLFQGTQMWRSAERADDTCFYWNADLSFFISFFPPGESGLGKSTLINSLFLTDLYSSDYPGPSHRIKKTVQVRSCEEELQQGLLPARTVRSTRALGSDHFIALLRMRPAKTECRIFQTISGYGV